MNKRVIIVTGGRHYEDRATLGTVMHFLKPDLLVQGGASGADALAFDWATIHGIETDTIAANWNSLDAPDAVIKTRPDGSEYNANAGPARNRKMLDKYPEAILIAFPGGRGTENCITQAKIRKMIVLRVEK